MRLESPYHAGELLVQERVGVLSEGASNSRVIQDSIVRGALRFLSQQPMAILGSLDQDQNVWASVLMGKPGFMQAGDERTVTFDRTPIMHNPHDPFWDNITQHPEVGMLVIELASRRRLRVNGRITRVSDDLLHLHVRESYPNCPKYIQRRQMTTLGNGTDSPPLILERGDVLGSNHQALIIQADTFFVASAHPERGVDASHRGGNPGFVTVVDQRTLRIPDYLGNSMFNTLGNFVVNPRAGLIFLDLKSHRTLQLIGRPEILYHVDDPAGETGGTQRYWQFHLDRWLEIGPSPQFAGALLDYSPHNPPVRNGVGN